FDDEPLHPEHGGPARLLGPHLYFWKSAKWLGGVEVRHQGSPRVWGGARYRAAPRGLARILGGLRLSQLWRPMERAAVRRRLTWQIARVVEIVTENARTKSIVLDTAEWPGHRAGQHVDVRLTAEDGYQAQRSYSIASAPEDEHLVLTVERLDDGEVSPYLTETIQPGEELEL